MKSRILLLSSFCLLAIVAIGCGKDDPNPINNSGNNSTNGELSGTIVDVASGRPIAGVAVTTMPATKIVVTDSTGAYSFGDVAAGTYSITASKSAYVPNSAQITISTGKGGKADIPLTFIGTGNSDALVAYYPFNGNAKDATGHGHDGINSGATLTTDRHGNANRAFRFGDSTFVTVPHDDRLNLPGTESFTISAWAKLEGAQADYTGIVAKGRQRNPFPGYMLVVRNLHNPGNVAGGAVGDQGELLAFGKSKLDDGAWHCITMVYNDVLKQLKLYVDGSLQSTTTLSALSTAFSNTEPLLIGIERNRHIWFTGAIDEVRVYRVALTAIEVETLAHQ